MLTKNSFEWLAYKQLERRYQGDEQVSLEVSEAYHNIQDIQGHKIRFHHGDGIRFLGGSGGLTIPMNKAIAQWNKGLRVDLDVFGHWHQYLRTWDFISCGCLIGFSPYAIRIKASFQPPTQTFLLIDKDRGLVTAEPIFLE